MDGDELSSLLMADVSFPEEETEMLDLLFANGVPPLQTKQEWPAESFLESLETISYPVPPTFPTFDCEVNAQGSMPQFLSSPEHSPPSSPGGSSQGESSPDIGSAELYDSVSLHVPFMATHDCSTANLLGSGFTPQLGTIDPSTLHSAPHFSCPSSPGEATPSSTEKTETRKRKRSRKTKEEPVLQTAVTLPRKQLLKLSSKELDEYATRLRAARPLTPTEEKDLRRQRRLIKNRESASLSRQRRKEHMDDLEVQVAALNAENDQLKARVEQLSAENAALRERLQYHESQEQSPSLGERFRKLTKVNASPFSTKASAATAGACLAIVLFGFGLLFNGPMQADLSRSGSFYAPPVVVEGIVPTIPIEPEIASITKARGVENNEYGFPEWRIRKPLGMDELGSAAMPIDVDSEEQVIAIPFVAKKASLLPTTLESEPSVPLGPLAVNTSTDLYGDTPQQLLTPEHKASPSYLHSNEPAAPSSQQTSPTNTSVFLLCPQVQPVWAPDLETKRDISEDSLITFLLPADITGNVDNNPHSNDKVLLRVACRIADVKSVCVRFTEGEATPSVVPCSS